MGAILKKAAVTPTHRAISVVIALVFLAAVISGFGGAIREEYEAAMGPEWLLLLIPTAHAVYNDSRWFILGEEKGTMNMGVSKLSSAMSALMGITAVTWLILAGVLSSIK
jgi:hypothetical protein